MGQRCRCICYRCRLPPATIGFADCRAPSAGTADSLSCACAELPASTAGRSPWGWPWGSRRSSDRTMMTPRCSTRHQERYCVKCPPPSG
eukprot:scaffold55790_cov69-Phaeocystis_antarctica.AAC.2